MHFPVRRAGVAILAVAMTLTLAGPAGAAPLRDQARTTRPNPDVVMRGSGWGHSVGMSQFGAYAAAKAGWSYRRILMHYYPGTDVGPVAMPSSVRVGLGQAMPLSNVEAVTGAIPWRICRNGECQRVAWQPKGRTWSVTVTDTGEYQLKNGSTLKWRGAGTKLLGAFNPQGRADGTMIEAYSPNGVRRLYKYGMLDYSITSSSSATMYMVLDVPSIELYLRGLSEMPRWWGADGAAALQTQAVAARSYALLRHRRYGGYNPYCRCSVYATQYDQVYNGYDVERDDTDGYWRAAVKATAGMVPRYEGRAIEAVYSSAHGGRSENSEDSYAFDNAVPYLRSVDDPWSLRETSGNPFRSWDFPVSNGSFANFVGGGMARVRRVQVLGRTEGGTPRTVRVWGTDAYGRPAVTDRSGTKSVGVSLKVAYGAAGLKSQQIRRFAFKPFTDDDGTGNEYANLYAYSAGIMRDASIPRFRPRLDVTRGRAALYIYRTLAIPAASKSYYDDIANQPAKVRWAINALAAAGISDGLRTRTFRPGKVVTRAQMAVFFRNGLGMSKKNTDRDYFDDDDGRAGEAAINRMAMRGLVTGCGTRRFCPGGDMQRGPMAGLLLRIAENRR